MILHGNNLVIKLGGVAIAAAKSCTINVNASTQKVSSPNSGQWEHSIVSRKSWSVSVSHLIVAASSSATPLKSAIQRVGQTDTLSFECSGLSNDHMSGQAHCKSFKATGTMGNLVAASCEFEGTGPLS